MLNMFQKLYIIKFTFLLTVVQIALAVYLSLIGIVDGEFYNRLFFYSLSLSLIPILFGIIIFSLSSHENSFTTHSNGFVNKHTIEQSKNTQINDTSIHLFALGLLFLLYNLIFRILILPDWIIFVLPLLLAIVILKNNQRNLILCKD